MRKLTFMIFTIASLALASCGSTTSVTASYKEPNLKNESYKKVFVAALTDNTYAQQAVENSMSKLLSDRNVSSIKSMDVLPPNFRKTAEKKDKELVVQKMREKGCDAIMTIALIDAKHETRYVQESTPYYPIGVPYYGGFGTYYMYGYDNFYSPGYYTDDKVYFLEANVYDAATEKLVWSAQSKTYNPSSIDDFLKGYAKALSERMTSDGLMLKK